MSATMSDTKQSIKKWRCFKILKYMSTRLVKKLKSNNTLVRKKVKPLKHLYAVGSIKILTIAVETNLTLSSKVNEVFTLQPRKSIFRYIS